MLQARQSFCRPENLPTGWSASAKKGHPGLLWVEFESAAVEEDGGSDVVSVSVSAGSAFDGHDFAIHSFGHRVTRFCFENSFQPNK